jgi:hypothetical protein
MDSLFKIWNGVLVHNNAIDKSIFKYFIDQVKNNISCNDAVTLESHFKSLPERCLNDISGAFRDHALLLLKNPNIEWTDSNISSIQKLLQDDNLNWRSDDVILSLELISRSNNFGLLNIFPEILDYWFSRDFSDTKKRLPDICISWFTLLLGTSEKNITNGSNFIFSIFHQLECMYPLLGQRNNVWKNLTTVAVNRVKGCSETRILSATKLMAQIKRD